MSIPLTGREGECIMMIEKGKSMGVDAQTLRRAMRLWATGVTVVTALSEGQKHGMTVSSFTSLALEPALVLVSLEALARTHGMVERSGRFGVTILAQDQQEVSDRFGGRIADSEDRFAGLETETLRSGVPFVKGGLAYFDCQVVAQHPAGTHTLFIGEVTAVRITKRGSPLLYFNRDYRKLS
jgi:flavin reductase (DIM6/NTAB) family NADH-FMN oxidoreductase RutF